MGPPCVPEEVWHLCEPAMTIIPNFLLTGILATILGILTLIWAAAFVHRKRGGLVLILLSVALLLFGGGIFPPIIGIVAGVVATRIHAPVKREPTRLTAFLATLWPWSLVAFLTWLFGQFVAGYFFNEFMIRSGFFNPIMILVLMALAIASAFAYDVQEDYGD
jgi:MFS family permease